MRTGAKMGESDVSSVGPCSLSCLRVIGPLWVPVMQVGVLGTPESFVL